MSSQSYSLAFDGRRRLAPADLEEAARPITLSFSNSARDRVARCARFVKEHADAGNAIYGLSTGFGPLVSFGASVDAGAQGSGLLNHLRTGQGEMLAPPVARAMLLARAWSMGQGHSGVSLGVLDALSAALAVPWAPAVPEWGSVGASGDLAPLAQAA